MKRAAAEKLSTKIAQRGSAVLTEGVLNHQVGAVQWEARPAEEDLEEEEEMEEEMAEEMEEEMHRSARRQECKRVHIVNRHVKAPRAQSIGKAKLARRHGGHSAASPDGLEAPCLACTKGKHCAHTCGVRGKAAAAAAAAAGLSADAAGGGTWGA